MRLRTSHKYLIAGITLVVGGFVFFTALSATGYVCYRVGYKRGASAMADYVRQYLSEQTPAPHAPKGDDETGDVGHFGS